MSSDEAGAARETYVPELGRALCIDPWPGGANRKRINLALQGGGAHGALTWGVLERLLEDDEIAIEGLSGASAGAVNGAVLAYGLSIGGREGARDLLGKVWQRVSNLSALSPVQPSLLDRFLGGGRMDYSPGYWALETLGRLMSPYQFNPFNLNPLRETLKEYVDFSVLRHCRALKLFINATSVKRGRIRVFSLEELTLDAVAASACLPFLQPAVQIDGEPYWDGGYMGNPAIFPLIESTDTRDIVIVQLNPVNIEHTPVSAPEILDRINTITFNAGLMREMRAIKFVTDLVEAGIDGDGRLKRLLMHVVHAEDVMQDLGVSSKLNADWSFLQSLRQTGYERMDAWLALNRDSIGRESTVDLAEMYL